MRALLGLLLLGTLFLMAASWQKRTTKGRHDARARQFNINSEANFDEDWSRLLVGRPSGGEPIPLPATELPQDSTSTALDSGSAAFDEGNSEGNSARTTAAATPRIPPDEVYIVKNGDVLGTICQRHYEVRPLLKVVERVARYNDLASPDSIGEGDELRLPDAAVLFP